MIGGVGARAEQLLTFRRMLEAAVNHGSQQLGLQHKISKVGGVNVDIMASTGTGDII